MYNESSGREAHHLRRHILVWEWALWRACQVVFLSVSLSLRICPHVVDKCGEVVSRSTLNIEVDSDGGHQRLVLLREWIMYRLPVQNHSVTKWTILTFTA